MAIHRIAAATGWAPRFTLGTAVADLLDWRRAA
jgi:nucleoside-diphosphate-sugar epimerase